MRKIPGIAVISVIEAFLIMYIANAAGSRGANTLMSAPALMSHATGSILLRLVILTFICNLLSAFIS